MKTGEAKTLLQKYLEAETSLEEEKLLASYFRHNDLSEDMKPYKKWFEGVEGIKPAEETGSFEDQVIQKILKQEASPKIRRFNFSIIVSGIAASLIIVAGSLMFYFRQPAYRDTFNDSSQAAAYAEKTLEFVSSEYNKGLAQLAPVHQLENGTRPIERSVKTINKGLAKMNKLQLVNKLKTNE